MRRHLALDAGARVSPRHRRAVAYAASLAAALTCGVAGVASASISDGAEDTGEDPVLVVTCHVEGDPPVEVCFEAQKGGVAEPEPDPAPGVEGDPTVPVDPVDSDDSVDEGAVGDGEVDPEPSVPTDPDAPTAPPAPTAPSAPPAPSAPADGPVPEAAGDARSGGQAPAEGRTAASAPAPVAVLPNTGIDDVDPGLAALGLALTLAGGLLVRRARVL